MPLRADGIVMSGRGLSPEGRFGRAALIQKAKAIETIARKLKDSGLRLAYHNHNPEFANHNAEMNGLAENTDPELVEFMMDAGHGYLGGGDPAAFLAGHSRRVYGIHLKTFRGKETSGQAPLGQGDFGFEALGPDRAYIRRLFGV